MPLYVTSPVVDEVNESHDENELVELGLIIIEAEIEDVYAASNRFGPFSFEEPTPRSPELYRMGSSPSSRESIHKRGVPSNKRLTSLHPPPIRLYKMMKSDELLCGTIDNTLQKEEAVVEGSASFALVPTDFNMPEMD